MKRLMQLATTLGLLLALFGCSGTGFVGIVVTLPPYQPNDLRILSASASSNYRSSGGENFICDNRTTTVSYQFTYNDPNLLASWQSFLKGYASGDIAGVVSFSASNPANNTVSRTVSVDYIISPQAAPLGQPAGVSSQAIVVVPNPSVIGRTYVIIRVQSTLGTNQDIVLGPIRVIDNCP